MVPIKVAIAISIAIGFVFLFVYFSGGACPQKNKQREKTKPMAISTFIGTIFNRKTKCTYPCTPGPCGCFRRNNLSIWKKGDFMISLYRLYLRSLITKPKTRKSMKLHLFCIRRLRFDYGSLHGNFFWKTLNGRLPFEHDPYTRQTLPKRVSDDSQHFIFRRQRSTFCLNFRRNFWIEKSVFC